MEFIRDGHGPYFLEYVTYRYRGHSMGDPERYRQAEEVKKWQETDPIGIYHKHLIEQRIVEVAELDAIDQRVADEVRDAVQFAENSPEPAPESLFDNIYVEP